MQQPRETVFSGLTGNLVYDPVGMAWIRMLQPILEAGSVTVSSIVTGTVTSNQGTKGSQGWFVDPSTETLYTAVYDYDGSNLLIYSGKAAIGSAKSSAVWQIKKYSYSGTNLTDIQWAGGTQSFIKVWNNRASLSYS